MYGCQAAGAAPIVHGKPIEAPETIATAIRIGNPASWQGALDAIEQSEGEISAATDEKILEAYHHLASREGVFCEPASAASVAGLLARHRSGSEICPEGGKVVCTLTGHGLKDPDRAVDGLDIPAPAQSNLESLRQRMEL